MTKYIYTAILILSILVSCSNDDNPVVLEDQPTLILLDMLDNTRGTITEVDILAFKVDPNDPTIERFAYRTKGKDLGGGISGPEKLLVSLQKGGGKYRFVVIANASSSVDALGDISTSALKDFVLDRITYSIDGKWITNTTDPNFKEIPLWGQSQQIEVNDLTQSIPVRLLRMLARIDVNVSLPSQSEFKLKSARLYNYSTKANVAPKTDATHWDGTKVLQPTIPSDNINKLGPLVYDQLSVEDISITESIYAFESKALDESEHSKMTCLVIGGVYGTDTKETFYRVDISRTLVTGAIYYMDLLRNNLYNVRISSVLASGYDTPEEAFNAKSININTDIIVWENTELSDVAFDGQYHLRVNKGEYTFGRNPITASDQTGVLSITTDYPTGWTIEKITDPLDAPISWLRTSVNSGNANVKTDLHIIVDENSTGVSRYGNIHIKAGRLNFIIKVEQSNVAPFTLDITDDEDNDISELIFNSYVTEGSVPSKTFKVKWSPQEINNLVTVSTIGGTPFNFSSGDVITSGVISDPSGTKTYIIRPPAMTAEEIALDPFLVKSSNIEFLINEGVRTRLKNIILKQINFDARPTVDANFIMNGTEQYIKINANSPWKIEVLSDPKNILQTLRTTSGGYNMDKQEERVYFTPVNDMSSGTIGEGTVTLRIKPVNLAFPFPDHDVTLNFYSGQIVPFSNSYIVAPSSRSIIIPVGRANQAVARSIENEARINAELVWTDNINRIAPNSNISRVIALGRGGNGYLLFTPGSASGNAVVAVTDAEGIKWSWHLWITSYNPDVTNRTLNGFTLMDRNLGASANNNNAGAIGLLYQWGRKDPFPGANNNGTSNTGVPIYNASGSVNPALVSTTNSGTLANSIANPLTFYFGTASWVGSTATNSWFDGGKTIYDPCPPGWMTPPTTLWNGLNTGNLVWSNYGRTNSTAGWFPAAGLRGSSNGVITQIGQSGQYWTSTYQTLLYFYSSSVTVNGTLSASNGASVRCIKE